jgi:hypothetical protein
MNDDIKHTALPWTYHSGCVYQDGPNVWPKGNNNGIRIALMDRDTELTQPTERDKNAAFIVKAANAHYPMLNLLRVIDKRLDVEAEERAPNESFMLAGYRNEIKEILKYADSPNPKGILVLCPDCAGVLVNGVCADGCGRR